MRRSREKKIVVLYIRFGIFDVQFSQKMFAQRCYRPPTFIVLFAIIKQKKMKREKRI